MDSNNPYNMKKIYTIILATLAISLLVIKSEAQQFSWSNYSAGSTSYSTSSRNVNMNVSLSVSGSGLNSNSPSYNSNNGGYLSAGVDWSNRNSSLTFTFTFSTPLKGVYMYIYDVDYSSGNWDDRLTITATNNNNATIYPTLIPAASAQVTGTNNNILEGKANNNTFLNDPSYLSFSTSVAVKSITIVYAAGSSSPTNPNGQIIGFAGVGSIEALPVDLMGFNASKSGSNANIKWETENQIRFSHFELERSSSAIGSFEKVAEIKATNTASGSYSYTDINVKAKAATAYYRLKMVDIDGTFTYSRVAMVRFENGAAIDVRPTLLRAGENINVTVAGNDNEQFTAKMFSMNGTMVSRAVKVSGGQASFPTNGLQKGMYLVTVEGGETPQTFKVMVQ